MSVIRLLGLLWPASLVAIAVAWPGQQAVPLLASPEPERAALSGPPADASGSLRYLAGEGVKGEAKVFWESPDKAKVKFVIELDPEQSSAKR